MLNLNGVDKSKPPCHYSHNDKGQYVKWWACPTLTNWATHSGFKDILGWVVEVDGADSYVLTQGKNIIFDTQRLEDAAVHIDFMRLNLTI